MPWTGSADVVRAHLHREGEFGVRGPLRSCKFHDWLSQGAGHRTLGHSSVRARNRDRTPRTNSMQTSAPAAEFTKTRCTTQTPAGCAKPRIEIHRWKQTRCQDVYCKCVPAVCQGHRNRSLCTSLAAIHWCRLARGNAFPMLLVVAVREIFNAGRGVENIFRTMRHTHMLAAQARGGLIVPALDCPKWLRCPTVKVALCSPVARGSARCIEPGVGC